MSEWRKQFFLTVLTCTFSKSYLRWTLPYLVLTKTYCCTLLQGTICSAFVYLGKKKKKKAPIWAANKNPNKIKDINTSSALKMRQQAAAIRMSQMRMGWPSVIVAGALHCCKDLLLLLISVVCFTSVFLHSRLKHKQRKPKGSLHIIWYIKLLCLFYNAPLQ